jgi:hypothetical protein
MLRSQSSHTLGQDQPVMHLLSPQSESSSLNLQGVQPEFTGQVTSPRPHLQSQHSDLEDMVRAAYMAAPLMRRAQSTGDLQVNSSLPWTYLSLLAYSIHRKTHGTKRHYKGEAPQALLRNRYLKTKVY